MARPVEKVTGESVPPLPGSYVLCLSLPVEIFIPIGRLGNFRFVTGEYLYLGSAWGSGGLRSRLKHHLQLTSKPHWHIDWLRRNTALEVLWYSTCPSRLECAWSQILLGLPGAYIPVAGFGASDCRSGCAAHLIGLPAGMPSNLIESQLHAVARDVIAMRVAF